MFLMSKKATVKGIVFRSACALSFNKPEKALPTKLKQHLDRTNLAKYKLLFQLIFFSFFFLLKEGVQYY